MSAAAKMPITRLTLEFPTGSLATELEKLKEVCSVVMEEPIAPAPKPFEETPIGRKIASTMQGGVHLRIDLFNKGMTQKSLSEATGIRQAKISLMISGKRSISLENAEKFSTIFSRPVDRYSQSIAE